MYKDISRTGDAYYVTLRNPNMHLLQNTQAHWRAIFYTIAFENPISAVILTEKLRKCQQYFSKGFSTDYGRYRSQLTTKKSQEKSSVIFAQNVRKVAHPDTDFK